MNQTHLKPRGSPSEHSLWRYPENFFLHVEELNLARTRLVKRTSMEAVFGRIGAESEIVAGVGSVKAETS